MQEIVESIGKAIMGAYEYCNRVNPLAAIWRTDNPTWLIQDGERLRTVRFTKGQLVRIDVTKHFTHIAEEEEKQYIVGEIKDVTEDNPPTHRILACWGASNHSFSFKLEDLKTNSSHYLKL